ncbi:MAG: HigA family addiction module antitoxin [Peptococcaceae bacterium]|nr:HigA family addiction module antitoxin [Peptococcaceae bacterium]
MSNYIEYADGVAFHPGYYIEELIDDAGLTQEEFAKRLDTTPKTLSLLVRGKQRLSVDIAAKLSRMLGTSIQYWLNLQSAFDATVAAHEGAAELDREREIFAYLEYKYFRIHFGLPDLPRQKDAQMKAVREFLGISSLTLLAKPDWAVRFRSATAHLSEGNIVKANVMVQIALNQALATATHKFNQDKFAQAVDRALTLTTAQENFYDTLQADFREAGVSLVILPNIPGSKINGATVKIDGHVVLMVNDRRAAADTFWFTLFHEIGHIMNGDLGISFEGETGAQESKADAYAADKLIPQADYETFVKQGSFTVQSITGFAQQMDRDPGIVLGRLQCDGHVRYNDRSLNTLRRPYKAAKS